MHSRAGADYGELLLEAKEVDDSANGLMPRGTAARLDQRWLGGGEQILDWAYHWYGLIN